MGCIDVEAGAVIVDDPYSVACILSRLSPAYIVKASINWRWLLWQLASVALSLALDKAGRSMAAKMAMMAMTTSNSIKVKAARRRDPDRLPAG